MELIFQQNKDFSYGKYFSLHVDQVKNKPTDSSSTDH